MTFLEKNLNKENIKFITDYIFIGDTLKESDCIFIPGSFCPELAVRASSIYKQGYSNLIVPSGKYSAKKKYKNNFNITESQFLKNILLKNNIEEENIICEEYATYTIENARFSKMLLEKKNIYVSKAIICCKSFHAKRCQLIYKLFFQNVDLYVSPVDVYGINKTNWFKTEYGMKIVLNEMKKIKEQVPHEKQLLKIDDYYGFY